MALANCSNASLRWGLLGDDLKKNMTSGSMDTGLFSHFLYCTIVLLADMTLYEILCQQIKCSINAQMVVLAKRTQEKVNLYSICMSIPVIMNYWLNVVNLPPTDKQSLQGKCTILGA